MPWLEPLFTSQSSILLVHVAGLVLIIFISHKIFKWLKRLKAPVVSRQNPPVTTFEQFEQYYYHDLYQECQQYKLADLDGEQAENTIKMSLSDVYGDQNVSVSSEDDTPVAEIGRKTKRLHEKKRSLKILEALKEVGKKHILISGIVGSGKSSFVNYLSASIIDSMRGKISEILPDHLVNRPVVRILLRRIGKDIDAGLNESDMLIHIIDGQVRKHVCRGAESLTGGNYFSEQELKKFTESFIEKLKSDGLIILDGLDEVALFENKRATMVRYIYVFENNLDKKSRTQMIVTSRPYAVDDKLPKLLCLRIEPMGLEQSAGFIRHWYQQVGRDRPLDSQDPENRIRAEKLIKQIESRESLQILAETPMLLTLLLIMDYSNYQLPASRGELYNRAVNLLLQRWHRNLLPYKTALEPEEQSVLQVLENDEQSTERLRRALCKIALESYRDAQGNEASATKDILFKKGLVLKHLSRVYELDEHSEGLLYFLRFRSNLLVAPTSEDRGDNLMFFHKSFHDFLAAEAMDYLHDGEEILHGLLEDNKKRDWWREVLLFWLNRRKIGKLADFIGNHYVKKPLADISEDELSNHAEIIILCTRAAVEGGLKENARQSEDDYFSQLYCELQEKLACLMKNSGVSLLSRAECGRRLGRLGDGRRGVTTVKTGNGVPLIVGSGSARHRVPDICWERLPGSLFMMGSDDGDHQAYDYEKPCHEIEVKPFYISRYLITNSQFQCFIDAGGYSEKRFWRFKSALDWLRGKKVEFPNLSDKSLEEYRQWILEDTNRGKPRFWDQRKWNNPNHPAIGVSFYAALAFCAWLNEILHDKNISSSIAIAGQVRLPTEAEWEYAARGLSGLKFAWGNESDSSLGNYRDTGLGVTSCVGMFPASKGWLDRGVELFDMTGNVWEWTSSRWGKSVFSTNFSYKNWVEQDPIRNDLDNEDLRVIRGGSWDNTQDDVRCANRFRDRPNDRDYFVGFRVVYSTDSEPQV